MRYRVLQVAAFPFPSPQGSQVYVAGMCSALARRGHEVTVMCYAHGLGAVDPALRVVRTPRVPGYDTLRAGPDLVKPALDAAMALQLMRLARGADVVHAHNYEAPLAAWPACRRWGVPLIYNSHNTMAEELPTYSSGALAKRAAGLAGRALDRSVPRLADAAVAISEQAVPALRALGCRQVHHVPPGVALADFEGADGARARRRYGLGQGIWVVYAGNPDAYQDLDVLVDAVARTEELGLLMVSASPMEALERQAAGLPAARKRFIRTSAWPEVRDLIAAADIAALPRAVCSGYPIKLLNYLGLGVPTVCAEGSTRPIAGVLSSPNGDAEAFARALRRLAHDPARRRAMGEAAKEDVRARYSWDARAVDLERVYARVRMRR